MKNSGCFHLFLVLIFAGNWYSSWNCRREENAAEKVEKKLKSRKGRAADGKGPEPSRSENSRDQIALEGRFQKI